MASIRQLASCIGVNGSFSVLGDFFGFFRRVMPPDPTGARTQVSLLRQANLLKGAHFHLNVIAIGVDNFTDAEDIQIDYLIFKMRNIYNQVSIGVGRVQHFGVAVADSAGLDSPTTEGALEDITERWTVLNQALDLFLPFNMNVPSDGGSILGKSPVNGPCDKNAKGMNGSVVGLFGSEQTARSGSHEIGHYLGLGHENDKPTNLMAQSGVASSIRNSILLNSGQGDNCRDHCFIQGGCS